MNPTPPAGNRILVVDDEPSVRESVGYALEQEGFEVTLAANGEEAEGQISDDSFDLLILDIMMPGKSGLDLCREVRAHSPVPIILLTAKDAEVDKVVGLEVGADDYVTKPFSVRELLGRVRAQLRRRRAKRRKGGDGHDLPRAHVECRVLIDLAINRLEHVGRQLRRNIAKRSLDLFRRLAKNLADLLCTARSARGV